MSTIEDGPIDNIRSDLWMTMNFKQLDQQRILIGTRLQAVRDVMASGMVNPTTQGLHAALEYAMSTVDKLITDRLI